MVSFVMGALFKGSIARGANPGNVGIGTTSPSTLLLNTLGYAVLGIQALQGEIEGFKKQNEELKKRLEALEKASRKK